MRSWTSSSSKTRETILKNRSCTGIPRVASRISFTRGSRGIPIFSSGITMAAQSFSHGALSTNLPRLRTISRLTTKNNSEGGGDGDLAGASSCTAGRWLDELVYIIQHCFHRSFFVLYSTNPTDPVRRTGYISYTGTSRTVPIVKPYISEIDCQ